MRGTAARQVTRDELTLPDARAASWLAQLAAQIPAPDGDHGQLQITITVEWDHVRLGQ